MFNAQVNGTVPQSDVRAVGQSELPEAQTSALCLCISEHPFLRDPISRMHFSVVSFYISCSCSAFIYLFLLDSKPVSPLGYLNAASHVCNKNDHLSEVQRATRDFGENFIQFSSN